MSSSISRRLVFWLAVPLMLLALCGALVHYFNNVAPAMITSDQRLKGATNALMARARGRPADAVRSTRRPTDARAGAGESVEFAVRDQSGSAAARR